MDRKALQLGTLVLLAAGLTGFRIESQSSTTSNTPLVRKVVPKTRTNMVECNFYGLGWIPIGTPKSLDDVAQQMTAGADGLIDVSVESASTNFILVSWQCWRLAGTPFTWGSPLSAPAAVAEDGASQDAPAQAEEAAPTPVVPAGPTVSVVPPAPPKAEPHTKRLLTLIGAKRPESDDDYRRLCSEVWTLRMTNGFSESQMIQVARVGSSKVAPGSDLMTVLKAGVAAGAGK